MTAIIEIQRTNTSAVNDYTAVTETPEIKVTAEALAMQISRYRFGAELSKGRRVLEAACGSGSGLGYLARAGAHMVIGGDITGSLIRSASSYYGSRVGLLQFDAQTLPFKSASFDVILLYEALYYLAEPDAFVHETARVLRPGGHIVISSVNCEWADFNPSPCSTRYFSANELRRILEKHGFRARVYGGFAVQRANGSGRLVSLIKRAAIAAHVMPQTMKKKEWLKRLFLGPLQHAPRELTDGVGKHDPPVALDNLDFACDFKILYAVGMRE